MKKSEFPAIIAELEAKFSDLTLQCLTKFKLDPVAEADVDDLGENYAASNIGLVNAADLGGLNDEEYPTGEIKAWTRVMQKAHKLCIRMGLPTTNRNVILVSHHRTADKEYSK